MKKIELNIYKRLLAVLAANEDKQYAIFLVLRHFLQTVQSTLCALSICLVILFVAGDRHKLAPENLELILKLGFGSTLFYALVSLLLFVVAPGGNILQGLQKYWQARHHYRSCQNNAIQTQEALTQIKWQYRLWRPLRGLWYLLEIILALTLGVLFYALILAQGLELG